LKIINNQLKNIKKKLGKKTDLKKKRLNQVFVRFWFISIFYLIRTDPAIKLTEFRVGSQNGATWTQYLFSKSKGVFQYLIPYIL